MSRETDITIRYIEFELEKAEHGMGLPYDAERVGQLRKTSRGTQAETVRRVEGETGSRRGLGMVLIATEKLFSANFHDDQDLRGPPRLHEGTRHS
jgi:hypothetical protein